MDSVKPAARHDIAAQADLIGAVRLPSQAFSRVAGTEVVTDLLIFRRREPTVAAGLDTLDWINTEPVELLDPNSDAEEQIPVNVYFNNNPHRVLGVMELGRGLHGSAQLTVAGSTGHELAAQLAALTLELRMAAESPESNAKAQAAERRMKMRGREPGWSLHLNPTPALVEELGYLNGDALRRAVRVRESIALEQHQHDISPRDRDRTRSADGPGLA